MCPENLFLLQQYFIVFNIHKQNVLKYLCHSCFLWWSVGTGWWHFID